MHDKDFKYGGKNEKFASVYDGSLIFLHVKGCQKALADTFY